VATFKEKYPYEDVAVIVVLICCVFWRWALPEPMAQAGFYYQPSSTGDDRAMCFTCNVCLVCWEPTDEPWFVNIFWCS